MHRGRSLRKPCVAACPWGTRAGTSGLEVTYHPVSRADLQDRGGGTGLLLAPAHVPPCITPMAVPWPHLWLTPWSVTPGCQPQTLTSLTQAEEGFQERMLGVQLPPGGK